MFTALLIGLASSLHCIGMCGPIVLSLPGVTNSSRSAWLSALLYNSGRISTYILLGAIAGVIGQGGVLIGIQRELTVAIGIVLLIVAFFAINMDAKIGRTAPALWIKQQLGKAIHRQYGKQGGFWGVFVIGQLNGLLPCGMVYAAVTASLSQTSILSGMAYMAFFGLGTLPLMYGVILGQQLVTITMRRKLIKLVPYVLAVTGVWLICRGVLLSPHALAEHAVMCN